MLIQLLQHTIWYFSVELCHVFYADFRNTLKLFDNFWENNTGLRTKRVTTIFIILKHFFRLKCKLFQQKTHKVLVLFTHETLRM